MLNKKELEQTADFLATLEDLARSMLDELATYEAIIEENRAERKKETVDRYARRKKRLNKRKAMSK